MDENYDMWNNKKKHINKIMVYREYFPNNAEVWICILGKNIGQEQNGEDIGFSRPMLVLKKINNSLFIVVPLSTKQKDIDFYFNFTDMGGNDVSVILAHIRCLSIRRFERKLYSINIDNIEKFKEIQVKMIKLFFT